MKWTREVRERSTNTDSPRSPVVHGELPIRPMRVTSRSLTIASMTVAPNSSSARFKLAITHPGGAHKDEVLAACVVIACDGCPVARREPSGEELDDPEIAVLDIGGRHEPELGNFDHHQFDRSHPPTCSLSLVLDALGLYDDALEFCDWLETAERFDSRGPNRTAEWLEVPRRAISRLSSPIDGTLLRRFAAEVMHEPGETVYEFMKLIGEDLLEYLRSVRAELDAIEGRVERWSVAVGDDTIETLFVARADGPLENPSGGLTRYARHSGVGEALGAIVYPDSRGSGYGIGRYEDDPRLDFSRVAGEDDVHFAHASGFMCKTTATAPERLRELIAGAAFS